MRRDELDRARLLAEVLRLQRWAGGESVPAARIFGLMHGFQSVLDQESESSGISKETQRKVEDLLEDVENGKQCSDGPSIKNKLREKEVDEIDAQCVMEMCRLESRFIQGIKKIANGRGSVFASVDKLRLPEQDWFGAFHYMELYDSTEEVSKKLHAVVAPVVPRVGEVVVPQSGSRMLVVAVEHVLAKQGEGEGVGQVIMIPYVYLESIDDQEVGEE
jgi:hypothetical protein